MKKIVSVIIILTIALSISAQSGKFSITGNLEDAEGIQLQLQKNAGGKMTTVCEAVVKNNKFIMGGSVEYPEMVYLVTADKKYRLTFYIENSNITISGKLAYLADAEVKGSKTQDENIELSALIFPLSKQYASTIKEYEEAKKTGNNALAEEKMKQISGMSDQAMKIQKDFIMSHPASFVNPVLLRSISNGMGGSELETIINSLDPAVAKTPIVASLRSRIDVLKSVEPGKKAPDFTLNDPNGKPIALSSLTGKNILLVDFWAGWCGPCRAENPNVVKVYNEFKNKGFDILGVSLDKTADEWNKAIADDKLTWTHISDLKYWNSSAARLYGVNSIPANFLLDKNGIIIAKNLRGEELYNKVKELVGK